MEHFGGEHNIGDAVSSYCIPSGGEHIASGDPTFLFDGSVGACLADLSIVQVHVSLCH